ncbi:GNAT family N-acetyltransferase [Kitasatospora sp. NPDC054939]
MTWLPDDFVHPLRAELPGGFHLRPIKGSDTDLDYPAVMGSRERLWSVYGEAWGWPPATMTVEQDREDLIRHEVEIEAHESFNYALFDNAETVLLGCVYIDPPQKSGSDAEISWWVVDEHIGTALERDLDALVPRWLAEEWPFTRPSLIGHTISWKEWLALPDRPGTTTAG